MPIRINHGDVSVLYTFRECNFQEMLDLLPGSNWIDISTFNISQKDKALHEILAKCQGVPVRFITKIPNWMEYYWRADQRKSFKELFAIYRARLDPAQYKCRFQGFFNVHNHSKLVITDRAAYIGSANYSVESSKNHECGVIFYHPEVIHRIRVEMFEWLLGTSFPRDVSELNKARMYFQQFLEGIPNIFAPLDEGLFEPNDDVISGLRGFDFSFRGTTAEIPEGSVEEVAAYLNQLEQDFGEFKEHKHLKVITEFLPEAELNELRDAVTEDDGAFVKLANFDLSVATDKYMQKHSEGPYAFNADACADSASNDAQDEYQGLISAVHEAYNRIKDQLKAKTEALLAELDRLEKTTWGVDNT